MSIRKNFKYLIQFHLINFIIVLEDNLFQKDLMFIKSNKMVKIVWRIIP